MSGILANERALSGRAGQTLGHRVYSLVRAFSRTLSAPVAFVSR